MICNKDAGGGNTFWKAGMDSRVILPNGGGAIGQPMNLRDGGSSTEMTGTSSSILSLARNEQRTRITSRIRPHYANGWSNGAGVIDLTEHLVLRRQRREVRLPCGRRIPTST